MEEDKTANVGNNRCLPSSPAGVPGESTIGASNNVVMDASSLPLSEKAGKDEEVETDPDFEPRPDHNIAALTSNTDMDLDLEVTAGDVSGAKGEKRKKEKKARESSALTAVKPRKKRKQGSINTETAFGYPSLETDELDEYVKQPRKNKASVTGKTKKQQLKEVNKIASTTTTSSTSKAANLSNPTTTNARNKKPKKLPKATATAIDAADTAGGASPSLQSTTSSAFGGIAPAYSAAQTAVNDMMRRALEEDQYSALGSIVDTDSSDEDEYNAVLIPTLYSRKDSSHTGTDGLTATEAPPPNRRSAKSTSLTITSAQTTYTRLDRLCLIQAMKKRARMEGIKHASTRSLAKTPHLGVATNAGLTIQKNVANEELPTNTLPSSAVLSNVDLVMDSPAASDDGTDDEDLNHKGGRKRRGGRRKKGDNISDDDADVKRQGGYSVGATTTGCIEALRPITATSGVFEAPFPEEEEEEALYGKGKSSASNATWVQCDRCKKWRRLRGVVDAKKLNLPTKWYCSMNKNDPERSKCTAPEEEYDSALNTAPETVADQRTRKHIRLWVRRLQCNEAYEAKLPTMTRQKKKSISSAKEPYDWIKCCNPSCGKWRAILKFMDKQTIIDNCKNACLQ